MMKTFTLGILIVGVSCGFSIPSLASWEGQATTTAVSIPQQPLTPDEEDGPITDTKPGIIVNTKGVEIGTIKDFVLDLEAGRIVYIIGAFDRFRQFGDKLFVIPWRRVKVDAEMTTFTLSGDMKVLE